MFRWTTLRGFFGVQSFFAVVAVVIAVSSAPIFQNIGTDPGLERTLLAGHYLALLFALITLFFGTLIFHNHCPESIKDYPSLLKFSRRNQVGAFHNNEVSEEDKKEWKAWNTAEEGRGSASGALLAFLILFLLAFGLQAAALVQFARSAGPDRKVCQLAPPPATPAPKGAGGSQATQLPPQVPTASLPSVSFRTPRKSSSSPRGNPSPRIVAPKRVEPCRK